ncbi:MAG: NTP transferase domain-containing protein [Sphingomonas sp.]
MKAIILSAGYGSRLLPLTTLIPKCLVQVDGRELLLHQLDALHAAGISETVVVVGYRHDQVEAFARRDLPVRVTTLFNPFWSVANSIGSVWVAREHLERPFCLMNGDTLFDGAMLADAIDRAPTGVGLLVEPLRAAETDDMRVCVVDGQVKAVAKDLPLGEATHRSLGVITSSGGHAYRHALDAAIAEEGGQAAYHHSVVARLAQTGDVAAIDREDGRWQEIDRPEDIDAWSRRHGSGAA